MGSSVAPQLSLHVGVPPPPLNKRVASLHLGVGKNRRWEEIEDEDPERLGVKRMKAHHDLEPGHVQDITITCI